jgi:hypothetical protein
MYLFVLILNYFKDENEEVWKIVSEQIRSLMPIKSLNWKTRTGAARTIPYVDVRFVSLQDLTKTQFVNNTLNLYLQPVLHIYFFQCEDNTEYKNVWKDKIKLWVDSMVIALLFNDQTDARIFNRSCFWTKIDGSTNYLNIEVGGV